MPENVESVAVPYADVAAGESAVNLAKLLAKCGLAESVSDGSRKLKQKSVKVDGEVEDRTGHAGQDSVRAAFARWALHEAGRDQLRELHGWE